MFSPYGLDVIESCLTCKMRTERIFCDLPTLALQAFENIKYPTTYPKGTILFLEGQAPRGIFVLCEGQVKLSMSVRDGKTLILRIAEVGEVLGLSATVSGKPYELTAETIGPCQVNFVKRADLVRFLKDHVDALETRLVWKPSRATRSPFYPLWEVSSASETVWVDQSGRVWRELAPPGPG